MTHYVYSNKESDFEDGKDYRNPHFFEHTYTDAETVQIDGNYPNIVKAYEEAGVKIVGYTDSSKKAEKPVHIETQSTGSGQLEITSEADEKAALIEALAERGISKDARSSVTNLQKLLSEAEEDDHE